GPLILELTRCLANSLLCFRDLLVSSLRGFVKLGLIVRHSAAPVMEPRTPTNEHTKKLESRTARLMRRFCNTLFHYDRNHNDESRRTSGAARKSGRRTR